mmetsp:Transcript_2192/g.4485  ORF Transcript_2192/g.4485 Transcript_2192/m.4485 type:complete len:201 (+) Transcript_2192:1816-2418(+)
MLTECGLWVEYQLCRLAQLEAIEDLGPPWRHYWVAQPEALLSLLPEHPLVFVEHSAPSYDHLRVRLRRRPERATAFGVNRPCVQRALDDVALLVELHRDDADQMQLVLEHCILGHAERFVTLRTKAVLRLNDHLGSLRLLHRAHNLAEAGWTQGLKAWVGFLVDVKDRRRGGVDVVEDESVLLKLAEYSHLDLEGWIRIV